MAESTTKRKKPLKQCPHCKKMVPARSATCPECNKPIPKKAGTTKKNVNGADLEKLALQFAFMQQGTIEKAIKAVEAYKADTVASFIDACGGTSAALSQLKALQEQKK